MIQLGSEGHLQLQHAARIKGVSYANGLCQRSSSKAQVKEACPYCRPWAAGHGWPQAEQVSDHLHQPPRVIQDAVR